MSEAKKQNYLHGAAIMTATTVIVKIVGFLYKIPLGSMSLLGDQGYTHFMVAYNIYSFFLTLATAGFPVALSRMISEADTLRRDAQVQRIFQVAAAALAVIGGAFSAVMLIFHQPLSLLMGDEGAASSIIALSPAVFVVCVTSAYRGYCQGRGNMIPTSLGQVVEETGKLLVGLSLAFFLVRRGRDMSTASAGAIFGVTAGALAALVYMASYKRRNYQEKPYAFRDAPDSRSTILRNFLRIGIPIAIGSSVLSLINLLDNALCLKRLQSAAGFSHTEAITLYGVYGKAQMFYNLPSYFITPLILTVVPAVAGCMAQRRRDEASEIAESTLRIGAVVALPMAVGLSVLAEPIIHTLYWGSNPAGAPLLRALGPAAFFVCMALLSNAVLQAIGREQLPVLSIAVGGVVKIGVNWFLVGSPQINIFGAPVGSSCCYGVICVLDYLFLSRALKHRPRLRRVLLAPLLASLVMGAGAWGVYGLLSRLLTRGGVLARGPMAVALAGTVAVSFVIYGIMVSVTRAITLDDMRRLPRGEKLARLLRLRQ